MNKEPAIKSTSLEGRRAQALMNRLEASMLNSPQAECSVEHHFSPGLYIREVSMPAGASVVGHYHKTEHLNLMLKGKMILINPDGTRSELSAPVMYTAPPGRKSAYIIEDVIWQNIFPTEETDIDRLEDIFLDKSDVFLQAQEAANAAEHASRENDRADFIDAISGLGYTEDRVREISVNEDDQTEMPTPCRSFRIAKSSIEGDGFFITSPADAGEIIAPARINGKRTPAGRYVNHSENPNARMVVLENGDIDLVATERIKGCCGGSAGEEVTICYRETLRNKSCPQ